MYESCVSHLECSYQNPNLQCVDFLCYCPLPYVLTEAHRCISPPDPHNNMIFAIAPAAMLIAVVLMIGGAYTYKRVVARGGGGWSSASSVTGLRTSIDRPSDSVRRVSNRTGRKAEASRRMRRSLDEHGAALMRGAKVPRHPPRYIRSRPREQSFQKSFLQGARTNMLKEESTQSSESESVVPRHLGPNKVTANVILPVHEEVAVHIIRKSSTSSPGSLELSKNEMRAAEVPWLRQAPKETGRLESPTRLLPRDDALCRVLHQAEVKVSIEGHGSTSDDGKRIPSRFFGDKSSSQPLRSPTSKLREQVKTESTTEDSFMRELRYQISADTPKPSVQDRAVSTDIVLTMDSAVQPEKVVPDMVDRSQQMSDHPCLGIELDTTCQARKSVQIIEKKTTVPVHKLVQEIEEKQRAANVVEAPAKQIEKKIAKPQVLPLKETKTMAEKTSSVPEKREQSGRRLSFLKRIFSDSLPSKPGQVVTKEAPPPVVEVAKDDSEPPAKADLVDVVKDSHWDVEKGAKNVGIIKANVPLSPRSGTTVISGTSTTKSPAFSDVLQELIQQHAQRQARAAPQEDAPCKIIPEKTTPLPCEPSSTPVVSTGGSPTATITHSKGSVKDSRLQITPQYTTNRLPPACSPPFYTKTLEKFDMSAADSKAIGQVKNDTLNGVGHVILDVSSLNVPAVRGSEPRLGRNFLHPHTVRDNGIGDERPATSTQQVVLRRSSDRLSVGRNTPKMCAWGDSFSVSGETPSEESRLEGYISPSDPRNSGTGQAISLRQELEAAATDIGLEQTFRYPRVENNWNLTSPEAVLGSIDVESSETSQGGLRATLNDSVDVTSPMMIPTDERTLVAAKVQDGKAKKCDLKKRVNFQERPFADVLAEIEEDYQMPGEAYFAGVDKKNSANSDSTSEDILESSKNEDEQKSIHAFKVSRGGSIGNTEKRKLDDKNGNAENKAKQPAAIAPDAPGQKAGGKTRTQVRTEVPEIGQNQNLVERCGPKKLTKCTAPLPPSQAASSRNSIVSHPFCRSDEGPLLPSASTTLPFLSSDSNVSIEHRVTDLTCLQELANLAAPFQETGDRKSRTNLPDNTKPESQALQELHPSQWEPQLQLHHQESEQQMQPRNDSPSSPRASSLEDRSARPRRRLRMLQQAKRQDSKEDRSSWVPKRPNTGERQRVGRFEAKERRWGDDIIRVIMMGNKHYLHERSTTSPRPLPASIAAVPPLDETQYIAQQIDRSHSFTNNAAPMSRDPSPQVHPASGVAQRVADPEDTARTPRDSSANAAKQSSPGLSDHHKKQLSSTASVMPRSTGASPDPLVARHHATWGPSGEQHKMETITEVVCEIELRNPQAVAKAMEPKVCELVTGDMFSGNMLDLAKSPIQITVAEDSTDGFAPILTSKPGAERPLTPTCPQWDARERDLLASIKMLSAAFGTPESFSRTTELPSPDNLLLSETPTQASRVDAGSPSALGCSVVLEPSASELSHTRTGSPKSVRSRRPSILEGACFESIYNSILQPSSSTGLLLSIPMLGSQEFPGLFRIRGRTSGPTSGITAVQSQIKDTRDSWTETEGTTMVRPEFTAAQRSRGGYREVLDRRATEATAVAHCYVREESNRRTPPLSGEAPPIKVLGSSSNRQPSSGSLLQGKPNTGDILNDAFSEEDERSSFFSFEESASETCLLPDAASLEWMASSAASSSYADLG